MAKWRPDLSTGLDLTDLETNRVSFDDGITAPATESGRASVYVDTADGDLKIKFGDGFVATIATDSPGAAVTGFSGALAYLTADEALTTTVDVPWDATVYDVDDWWVSGSPTKLTVPSGVTKIILKAMMSLDTTVTDLQFRILKNDAAVLGMAYSRIDGSATQVHTINSAVLEVVAGDYFELQPTFSGTVTLRDHSGALSSWFSAVAVGTTQTGTTATVQTTDETPTVIASGSMAADSAHTIRAYGQGREDATGDTFHFNHFGGARNEGGTSSAPTPNKIEVADAGATGWDITLGANDTTDVWELTVTGEASHTIDWTVTYFEIIQ